jgi:hypothetical protein
MQLGHSDNFEQAYLQIHLSDFAHLWTVDEGTTVRICTAQHVQNKKKRFFN